MGHGGALGAPDRGWEVAWVADDGPEVVAEVRRGAVLGEEKCHGQEVFE
jgi:hypothetical protein